MKLSSLFSPARYTACAELAAMRSARAPKTRRIFATGVAIRSGVATPMGKPTEPRVGTCASGRLDLITLLTRQLQGIKKIQQLRAVSILVEAKAVMEKSRVSSQKFRRHVAVLRVSSQRLWRLVAILRVSSQQLRRHVVVLRVLGACICSGRRTLGLATGTCKRH